MASRIEVTVLYFAAVRDRLGVSRESISVEAGITVGALVDVLVQRHPMLPPLVPHLRVAMNQEFVAMDQPLVPGAEVALIPPVAGGARSFWLSSEPVALSDVLAIVSTPGKGGVVTFTGVVRENTRGRQVMRLEYEAYLPMAEKKLMEIGSDAQRRWPGCVLAIAHRLGKLAPGEIAVVIAASASHRKEAFEACEFAIDKLKQEAPIWKKEVYSDGQVWVGLGP